MNRWLCGLAASVLSGALLAAGPGPEAQAELKYLLTQDCGSCHGLRMTGGLGPPLTPEAMKDYPVDFIAGVILNGRGGTAMPPWRGILSDEDATWLAEYLKKGETP